MLQAGLNYEGNVALNSAIGAVSDVNLSGGNLNGNNAVIYSKFGDIKITDSQASMNGLIYAPFGTVTIDCDNFNLNGLIIAQNVVVNSTGANINYSNSWAEFVGTETEELSWTFDDWEYLADTDGDGLPNLIEKELGTKPYEADTDGDLLPDGYEVLSLGTDPLKVDTDDNSVSDYDEDFDTDGLSNGQEYEIGTRPYNDDSDGDNLKDGDEVNIYFTDPLDVDTDDDNLNDDDEIYFGTDPNDPDSDDNGTKDGDEKRSQKFIHKVENEDCAVTEVIVSMEATGNLQKTTTVESIMNKDMLCTNVVGLVGEPFSVETTSKFDNATLTYVIDKSKLGDTEFDNQLFLWYNESKDEFVELDTIIDEENSTVSINTTHFSKYMLVDQTEWFEAWRTAPNYFVNDEYVPYDTVITLDCSGSMSSYDLGFNYYYSDSFYRTVTYRQLVCEQYAASLAPGDRAAVVTFSSTAQKRTSLTGHSSDIQDAAHKFITNYGGTNYNDAIKTSIDLLLEESDDDHKKVIIFLSDGYPDSNNIDVTLIAKAVSKGIPIYTVGLGNSADAILEQIAKDTRGKFYKAKTANELEEIYSDISYEQYLNTDWDDNDEDKIPDVFEEQGLICSNGRTYYTRHDSKENGQDTDGDELVDGDEIIIEYGKKHIPYVNSPYADFNSAVYFTYSTDPIDEDTDGDLLPDGIDPKPLDSNTNFKMLYSDGPDYNQLAQARIDEGPTPPDFFTEHWRISEQEFATAERNLGETVMDVIWEEIAIFGSLYAYIPIANATTTAWSLLSGNISDGDKVAYGSAPNAAAMLDWFLFGGGAKCEISSDMFANLILSQEHNVEHYLKNLDACIIEAEGYVNEKNKNGMLESKSDVRLNPNVDAEGGLYVSCFANRGGNCPCGHGQVSLASKYACDWNLAIGEAFGSLQADVHYMGNDMYQMGYTYYIYDVYEWPDIQGLRDLHLHGVAHQYPIVGWITGSLIWKKGERCYNGALTESALLELNNNLSDVKEFFREMDINSDNMREVLEFYGIKF